MKSETRAPTPTEIGARSEAAVASALVRVQCKTSRVVGQVIVFPTCSNTNKERRDYTDQVDMFGIYSPSLNLVYLVPTSDLPRTGGSLRLAPARNGQRRRIMWADDYVLGPP